MRGEAALRPEVASGAAELRGLLKGWKLGWKGWKGWKTSELGFPINRTHGHKEDCVCPDGLGRSDATFVGKATSAL